MKDSRFSVIALLAVFAALVSGYTTSGFAQNPFSEGPYDVKIRESQTADPVIKIEVDETTKVDDAVAPVFLPPVNIKPAPVKIIKKPVIASFTAIAKVGDEYPKILDGYEDTSISISGDNYCGQFAMSSVLKGLGIECDPQKIYQETNPAGIFTAPPVIVDYLNKQGVSARQRHKASIDDIAAKIDAGQPVLVLVDSGGGIPHWVNIYGYDRDENGNITSVRMRDSYWGTSSGHQIEIEEFKKKWEKPLGDSLLGTFSNYKNLMIDINPGSTWPKNPPQVATEDSLATGINEVVTGWTNRDVAQLGIGINRLLSGIPGAVITLGCRLQSKNGDRITRYGRKKMEAGGIFNKVVGGAAVAAGTVVDVVGKIGQATGNVLSTITNSISNGLNRLFR